MKITKESIKGYIQTRKSTGASNQEIEDDFKNALRCKLLTVDDYYTAMKEIYRED